MAAPLLTQIDNNITIFHPHAHVRVPLPSISQKSVFFVGLNVSFYYRFFPFSANEQEEKIQLCLLKEANAFNLARAGAIHYSKSGH
jgi:hypothetical protein